MPQSLSNILIHVIFSTKDRVAYIDPQIRADFHAYIATVIRNTGCQCFRVGGVADHVHILVRLNRTQSVSKLLETLKSSSSSWIKEHGKDLDTFSWQRGYGAISIGQSQMPGLLAYIDDQENHHRTRTFQEEYRQLLIDNGIEFDEKYVWD